LKKNSSLAWNLDAIPWNSIDFELMRQRDDLFYLITAASFVEIAAELYADNLATYFCDDQEIVDWLQTSWKKEEVRHGQTLRKYVETVWPEFNWETAYADFYNEYSKKCVISPYGSSRALEMVARCVVETGTATFYEALAALTSEPVLQGITLNIRAEEINHYKNFYYFFNKLASGHPVSRLRILLTILSRLIEARNDDSECALWHVYCHDNENVSEPNKAEFKKIYDLLAKTIKSHYPVAVAIKMLIKPLRLPTQIKNILQLS
jgi:rubrerythrin